MSDGTCTRCEGEGQITEGRATREGKTEDIAHWCPECDGDGTAYTQRANGFNAGHAQTKDHR